MSERRLTPPLPRVRIVALAVAAMLISQACGRTGPTQAPGSTAASSSAAATAGTAVPTASPTQTTAPTPTLMPRPTATATPGALPSTTPRSTATPVPTPLATSYAGQTITYTIPPAKTYDRTIPEKSSLTAQPDGSVLAESARANKASLWAEWVLSPDTLPAGAHVTNVETLVCGEGTGDFYEVYGPYGADEVEYEMVPPRADGCWHFTKDPGSDYTVSIYVTGESTISIRRIAFQVTFGP